MSGFEYDVMVNNNKFTITDNYEIICKLKTDDEYLITYVINLIENGMGPPVHPEDIQGFLNIQRISEEITPNIASTSEQRKVEEVDEGEKNIWSSKGKRSENDEAAISLLLELRGSENFLRKFDDKKTVKLSLWREIAAEMKKCGFKVDAEKCRQKYLNLSKKYVAFVRDSKKTGNGKLSQFPYYEEMHKILGYKDKIQLPHITDTFGSSSKDSQEELHEVQDLDDSYEDLDTSFNSSITTSKCASKKQKNNVNHITKAHILEKIVECNEKAVKAQIENTDRILKVISEQNNFLNHQNKQRDRLIDIFQELAKPKNKKRRHSSDSD